MEASIFPLSIQIEFSNDSELTPLRSTHISPIGGYPTLDPNKNKEPNSEDKLNELSMYKGLKSNVAVVDSRTNSSGQESRSNLPLGTGTDHTSQNSKLRSYVWPANSPSQSWFLALSALEVAIVLGLQIYIFVVFSQNLPEDGSYRRIRSLQAYLSLFIFATLYQLIMTYLSLLRKNLLQIYIFLWFLGAMAVYSGIQYLELNQFLLLALEPAWQRATRAAIIIIILCLSLTLLIELILVFKKLRFEFDWDIYRHIGNSFQLKKLYNSLQLYKLLIMFDSFFLPLFTLQFIFINISRSDPEFYITILILPFTFVLLFLLFRLPKTRNIIIMIICNFLYLIGLAYVLFKIIRLYTRFDIGYMPGRKSLTTFGVISSLLLISTMSLTAVMWYRKDSAELVSPSQEKQQTLVID